MRKRLVIAGHSSEGYELIPVLEANPEVELCWLVTGDPPAALHALEVAAPEALERLAGRITTDVESALATPQLSAVIDAGAPAGVRRYLAGVRTVQITTPPLARLLYAHGPTEGFHKPDVLQALREILESYDLALDRRSLLDLVLQTAVAATGADRGSLMLWDAGERALRVEVAVGIEEELIAKIRVQTGEGVAGRAFAAQRPLLVTGKADARQYQITRERDDVASAISAPLVHGDGAIGVLNLSHTRHQDAFDEEDLAFVEQLARIDARIISRAEEYHGLVRESETLRAASGIRSQFTRDAPLQSRIGDVCALLASGLEGGVCELLLREPESGGLVLQASSARVDPLAVRDALQPGQGLPGLASQSGETVLLGQRDGDRVLRYAAVPLRAHDQVLGVLVLHGLEDPGASERAAERWESAADALAAELSDALRTARLERETRRSTRLGELFATLGACRDAETLYEQVTASAQNLVEAQDCVLRVREPGGSRFGIASWRGVGPWRRGPLAALERRLASDAIKARRGVRVADLTANPELAGHAVGVGTALIEPLVVDDRVIGCLSLLGKVPEEPLLGMGFDASDAELIARLGRATATVLHELAEVRPAETWARVDTSTGLPGREPLHRRLAEEIARSSRHGHPFALIELHLGGLAGLLQPPRDREGAAVVASLVAGLRGAVREFDLLARPETETFTVLAPEPDEDVPVLIGRLGRAVRAALEEHGDLAEQVELRVGYALYPLDGADPSALEARAAESRIETL